MNRKISVQFNDIAGKAVKFESLRELSKFLTQELKFWESHRESIAGEQNQFHSALSFSRLKQSVNTIKGWGETLKDWDDDQLQHHVNALKTNSLRHLYSDWLWSGHSFTSLFIECHKEHGNTAATAFLNYVVNNSVANVNSYEIFWGTMIGYEFINQDSDLVKRRNTEKASLGLLRNRLESNTNELIGEVEGFKESFDKWDSESRSNWDNQQKDNSDEFASFMDDCKTSISKLEETYQEKLRLEKPANYWKKAARKFGIQGGLWSLALIASVILGVVYFSSFFTEWLKGQQIGVQLNTVQGVVIFGTILATYAFLVRTLSRLTFSSFHLMRDAEEREQLTYLYLSLVNDKKIDESSRDIVLQALFSRTETGLLSAESGPTMPGVSEMLKAAARHK